jgi:hypothetical protein
MAAKSEKSPKKRSLSTGVGKVTSRAKELGIDYVLVASILIALVFQIYQTIKVGRGPQTLGNVALILPLLAILIAFLLFTYSAKRAEIRLTETLERRLPAVEYLETRIEVELENYRLVEKAKEVIVATGGKSRAEDYLTKIEEKCRAEEVTYWRLLFDEQPISHQMCGHLRNLMSLPNVVVAASREDGLANLVVTELGMILALPMPGHGGLVGISIPSISAARKTFRYLMTIYPSAQRLNEESEIIALCEECSITTPQEIALIPDSDRAPAQKDTS